MTEAPAGHLRSYVLCSPNTRSCVPLFFDSASFRRLPPRRFSCLVGRGYSHKWTVTSIMTLVACGAWERLDVGCDVVAAWGWRRQDAMLLRTLMSLVVNWIRRKVTRGSIHDRK
jgi:hypothetical protein